MDLALALHLNRYRDAGVWLEPKAGRKRRSLTHSAPGHLCIGIAWLDPDGGSMGFIAALGTAAVEADSELYEVCLG